MMMFDRYLEAAEGFAAAMAMEDGGEERTDALAENENAEEMDAGTETVMATIKKLRRDLDPATLTRWSGVVFTCDDGVERKMYFPGENGVYLMVGERGLLEHRDGAFVSFEKENGEIVTPLFRIPAGREEE